MTVRWTCPRSDAVPLRQDTVVWARHGVIGGTAARSWGAYELGGEQYAWTIRHGSGCDPRQDIDALAGALADDHLAVVVLTPGTDYTSQAVAEAIEDELLAEFGHTATVDSVTVDGQTRYRVTMPNAVAGLVGEASATKGVTTVCGIHDGSRRDGSGAVTGTLWIHTEVAAYDRDGVAVAAGTRARITGIGYFGMGSFRPRLAAALGPAHSLTPASIGPMQDAGRPASGSSNGYDPIVLPLPEAIACVIGDDAWIAVTDDGATGTLHYRAHATADWHGDLDTTENLLVEAARDDPDVALSGTVTPTITSNFTVHSFVFLVVECDDPGADDGSGFAGNGSLWVELGCRRDGAGETPTEDEPDGETFHYRMLTPPFSRVAFAQAAYSLAAVDADEDMSGAFYSWVSLNNPPASAPDRLGVTGLLGWDDGTPDEYNVTSFTRVPCGDDVVSDPYVSYGFTAGLIAGGAPTTLAIQFDVMEGAGSDFGADGERLYNQGQSPDLRVSDHVVGGLRDLAEFVSQPTSTMPYDDPDGAWPDPYDLAGIDLRPGNLGRAYAVIAEQSATADVFAVTETVDSVGAAAAVALEATAAASVAVAAAATGALALEATAAASVAVSAAASTSVRLAARVSFGGPADVPFGGGPMSDTVLSFVRGGGASPAATATRITLDGSPDSQAISPVPPATRGAVAVAGYVSVDEDAVIEFYDGDPDDSGTLLCDYSAVAGQIVPLAALALYSSPGLALWVQAAAVTVRGRAVTVET